MHNPPDTDDFRESAMIEHDCTVDSCQWKDIGDGYAATSCGCIFSKNKSGNYKRLYGNARKSGYLRVKIKRENKKVLKFIHVLICEAFIGPKPDGMMCCHWNGNPADNRVSNLRWGTALENYGDMLRHGTASALGVKTGEDHYLAKLDWTKVAIIRSEYTGRRGQIREFARTYGVSDEAISLVVKGKTWTSA